MLIGCVAGFCNGLVFICLIKSTLCCVAPRQTMAGVAGETSLSKCVVVMAFDPGLCPVLAGGLVMVYVGWLAPLFGIRWGCVPRLLPIGTIVDVCSPNRSNCLFEPFRSFCYRLAYFVQGHPASFVCLLNHSCLWHFSAWSIQIMSIPVWKALFGFITAVTHTCFCQFLYTYIAKSVPVYSTLLFLGSDYE